MFYITNSRNASYKCEIAQRNGGYFVAAVLKSTGTGYKTTVQTASNPNVGYNFFNEARPYPSKIVKTLAAAKAICDQEATRDFKAATIVTEDCPF